MGGGREHFAAGILQAPGRAGGTNCDGWTWGESTLRVYFDGELLATSDLSSDATHEDARIRLVTDEADDLFLALVADIPGHLLTRAASR